MVEPIREHTYSLAAYLESVKEEDIREDQDVQRLAGQWDAGMINELIYTVFTGDYILPIIMGEEDREAGTTQLWLVDGVQRTSSFMLFRYGNYKITSSIKKSVIEYQVKQVNPHGGFVRDSEENFVYETKTLDLKGQTFSSLPKELQRAFDNFQIKTVVHQHCTMERISELVCRYNNHKSMKPSQTAFTYVYKYARKIRSITNHSFFKDCGSFSEKDRLNGIYERVVCETIMAMFHLNNWQKQGKKMGDYLNENASNKEFDILEGELNRITAVVSDQYSDFFTGKDTFVWLALFHKFLGYGLQDRKFTEFLDAFRDGLHSKAVSECDNDTFEILNRNRATKDKKVVVKKLEILTALLKNYFNINEKEGMETDKNQSIPEFITAQTGRDITGEDIEFYEEILSDLTLNVDNDTELLNPENHLSLLALTAYSCHNDIDLDDWIVDYFKRNSTYIKNQKENYIYMLKDLTFYLKEKQ